MPETVAPSRITSHRLSTVGSAGTHWSELSEEQALRRPRHQAELVFVTRAMAKEWMEQKNDGNRKISRAEVKRWADRINLDRYYPTHQGIAFDEGGVLLDGQHRLAGLVASNAPGVWIQITKDLPRRTFDIIDVGRNRQPAQLIPNPNSVSKAAAARVLIGYPKLYARANERADPSLVVEAYEAHRDSIDRAVEMARPVARACGIPAGIHAAVIATVISSNGTPAAYLGSWCEGLRSGAGLEVGDPRLALRNRFATDDFLRSAGGRARHAAVYLVVKTWNAFIEGSPMTKATLPKAQNSIVIPELKR